jgi:16S rRNA (guanine527-N7)-methyltransferase
VNLPADIPEFVRQDLERLGVQLGEEVLTRLSRYLDLLLETNRQFNLTAVRDRDEAWRRHIIDSLTTVPVVEALASGGGGGGTFPGAGAMIDVGSGGGLPGVPVALALPLWRVTLLEATQKKARFLERCVKEVPLPGARVAAQRAELAGQDTTHRQQYDVAICRAIGPMSELLEYLLPLVKVGGRVLAMKGPKVEMELEQAGDALALLGGGELEIRSAYPESFHMDAVIVSITKDRPTPRQFPRAPGMPRLQPL